MEKDGKVKERYLDESSFFDKEVEDTLHQKKDFKLGNEKTYEQLFNEKPQLRPIVSFFGDIKDKKLLDLGCGDGWTSLYFARSGANVFCCDISPKSVELARKYAKANGLAGKITAEVMSAEDLRFEDKSFDFVFMNAALHHCDIENVSKEIKRVLKPNGKAALIEDYAYHPLLKIYRYLTKTRHTKFESPLTIEDINQFCSDFSKKELRYSRLFNIFESKNFFTNILQVLDYVVLRSCPKLCKYCKLIGVYVSK